MIIIPDVHGRKFWYNAVRGKKPGEKVIFLGDYLDPYTSYEGISHDQAYEIFLEIIDYKKENIDDVVLLLGNHDFGYIDDSMASCRYDRRNAKRNWKTFLDNKELFKIAYQEHIGKFEYLFSHAGVHKTWLDNLNTVFPFEEGLSIADYLNNLYETRKFDMIPYLAIYSNYRGWSGEQYGSCVWADVREWVNTPNLVPGVFQVFGHTSCKKPIFGQGFAMLDAQRGFRLENDNKFTEILEIKEENETRN